jgi:4'-phosphopantetheinyl transferase
MASELEIQWPVPPEDSSLGPRDVHVLAFALDQPAKCVASLSSTLSPDEHARARRFRQTRDQDRFRVARGGLRSLLARYLGVEPADLSFDYGPRGKPALAGAVDIHFNLAQSRGLALVAVTRLGDVGVDVEQLRPVRDADGIAERFFSPAEKAGLQTLPARQKSAAFFNLWTRKEAWLKATGEGITERLDRVEASYLPGEPARFLNLLGDTEATRQWWLMELMPAGGFVGAVAIRAREPRVECWLYL